MTTMTFFLLALAQPAGDLDDAIAAATRAVERDPKDAANYFRRGSAYARARRLPQALADLDRAVALDPKRADFYQERGMVNFKLSRFKESVRDFDKYLEIEPDKKMGHWQRGISLYYAGDYAEGRRQFEGYQDYDDSDVENAVWRFMCMARAGGVAAARQAILKVGPDRRVPMRQVYDLFKGDLQPDDVLAAARAGDDAKRQLFYAHLYVDIDHDLHGRRAEALQHLERAAGEYVIGHYMGDVARVHRDLLKKSRPE